MTLSSQHKVHGEGEVRVEGEGGGEERGVNVEVEGGRVEVEGGVWR